MKHLTAFEAPDEPGIFEITGHQKTFTEKELAAFMELTKDRIIWTVVRWQEPPNENSQPK
jgi:hypothetical protein